MNILEIGIQRGVEQGIEQGIEQGTRCTVMKIVRNMIEQGMSDEDIIKFSGCTQEMLEKVKQDKE